MTGPIPTRREHSAGGVVVRGTGSSAEFLAIQPRGSQRWQLPKGLIDRGETAREAAVREVREEGGVAGEIVADLDSVRYFYHSRGTRVAKTVEFFLMAYRGGNPEDHDGEVDEARWFPLAEADGLAFLSERQAVRQAVDLLHREER